VEAAVYFCCSEALQNMAKHASASGGSVHVWRADGRLKFEVQDNGHGYALDHNRSTGGLQNIRDRLEALGGALDVSSTAGGTCVAGWLPLA